MYDTDFITTLVISNDNITIAVGPYVPHNLSSVWAPRGPSRLRIILIYIPYDVYGIVVVNT